MLTQRTLPQPPRPVRRTRRYVTGNNVFVVLALLTIPWWCVPMGGKLLDVTRLLHAGAMTTATVTDSEEQNAFRAGKIYRLTLKFVDALGHSDTAETEVDYDTYSAKSMGDTVDITYLPSEPSVCRVGKVTSRQVDAVVREFLIGLLAMAGFYLLIALGIAVEDRKQSGLLRDGEVIPAKVTRLSRAGQQIYEIAYSFEHDGKTFKGIDRIDRKVQKPPTEGETVDVIFLPRQPSRCMALAAMVNFEIVGSPKDAVE